jgi:MoaA/NifB/PqqE/SkfB family radical SAM enzyme
VSNWISFSRRLDWELTRRCNLTCTHCISRIFHELIPAELDADGAARVVTRCAEGGIDQIHFFGGEPTVRSDFPALLSQCDAAGISTSFSTNATHLRRSLLETWSGLRHRRPVWVSFEDIRREAQDAIRGSGSFTAVCGGARQLAEVSGEVGLVVAFTVNRPAISDLQPKEILEFFSELGADHVVFQDLAVPTDASPELARLELDGGLWLDFLERLFDPGLDAPIPFTYKLKPLVIEHLNRRLGTDRPVAYNGCNALSTEFRLLPDGTLLPCSAAVGWPELLKRYVEQGAKLDSLPLEEILASDTYRSFVACKIERGVDPSMEPCRTCHLAYFRCNPCVFGRLTGQAHRVQACAWVREAQKASGHRSQVIVSRVND